MYYKCPACKHDVSADNAQSYSPCTMDKLAIFDELKIVTCHNCHFSFPNKKISEEDLEFYYSESYSGKAKKNKINNMREFDSSNTWYNVRYLSQIELIRKYIELNSNTKILEIGSGSGDLFRTLKHLGYKTKNYAHEPGGDTHSSLEMLGVTVLKFGLNTESMSKNNLKKYDLIVMSASLEHFNAVDIPNILNFIHNSLKDDGYFLNEVPNADLIKYPDAGERVIPHLAFFSNESIKYFFNDAGLEIVFQNTCGDNQFSKKISEETKGKADAQATKIYADSYQKDSDFFRFLRSNDVYRNSLKEGTTLLMDADSKFFKYLK